MFVKLLLKVRIQNQKGIN